MSVEIKSDVDAVRRGSPAVEPYERILRFVELSGTRVIDIGGGTGTYSFALKYEGRHSLVIDTSIHNLKQARSKGLDVARMASDRLGVKDCAFDTALLIEVIERVTDFRSTLREARRVAQQNVLITTPCHNSYFWLKRRGLYGEAIIPNEHLHFFTKAQLESVLGETFPTFRIVFGDPIRLFAATRPLAFVRLYAECGASLNSQLRLTTDSEFVDYYREPSGLLDLLPGYWNLVKILARKFARVIFPVGTARRAYLTAARNVLRTVSLSSLASRVRTSATNLIRGLEDAEVVQVQGPSNTEYRRMIKFARSVSEPKFETLRHLPKISIITPTFNTDPRWLRKCIESVRSQLYPHWELCIADDGSAQDATRNVLKEYADSDPRIKVKHLDKHLGIALASSEALSLATGEFVGFLDHDDELGTDALYEIAKLLNLRPETDFIYTDEDMVDTEGVRSSPFLKPDWSPDLLTSYNYVAHFVAYRRKIVEEIGGIRAGYDGSQDYDLALRFTEFTQNIAHVPMVLYSWRSAEGSALRSIYAKPYAYHAAVRALQESARRRGYEADGEELRAGGRYRLRYHLVDKPLISVLLPTRGGDNLDTSLTALAHASYKNLEVIVLDASSGDRTRRIASEHDVLWQRMDANLNYSRAYNFGARKASGEYLLLAHDGLQAIQPDWIEAMLEHSQQGKVGAVGAKLIDSRGRVQHAGMVLTRHGPKCYGGMLENEPGYYDYASVVRNCISVSSACLMVSKRVFAAQGMFDERLGFGFQDADYCLRLRRYGYRVVYTPFACLYHGEDVCGEIGDETGRDESREIFLQRWNSEIERGDPYCNKLKIRPWFG